MTEEGEKALLREYLATCSRLHAGFRASVAAAGFVLPVRAEDIDELPFDQETVVLSFVKRFEQFEDALH